MPRLIKRGRSNYTNTDNKLVRDDTLHWGPRGLFNYMWSQADNWQFYVKELVKHSPGGETELRNYLNELEEHGYLKRTPRHDGAGKFGGMDWILSDVGGLNRHAGNPDDGETSQNPGKVTRTPSCGETVGRSNRRTVNLTLSNNNNKNYQYKELSTNKKSSSSSKPSSSNDEIKDPFADDSEADDDEEVITGLIKMFSNEAHVSIPNYQYNHIKNSLLAMDQSDAIDLMYTVVNKVIQGEVQNPIGYLITSIASVKGGE
ncbi:hypothetical protein [Lactobacillus amylovorus]|uniref:hypothetical protein n=1 Tax=Lactobacillus amylovorus TaxID=1604 RepID=UPI00232DD659|nr:hypothetical protein [Lactobacillus amylovorus]MDB6263694.1 hypothetical protein [Lactobacillus amylovorus]